MVDRRHLDSSSFQGSKATLNDHESPVSTGRIFQANSIVIGLNDPFAIIFCGFSDFASIDTKAVGFGDRQILFEAPGCQKINGNR